MDRWRLCCQLFQKGENYEKEGTQVEAHSGNDPVSGLGLGRRVGGCLRLHESQAVPTGAQCGLLRLKSRWRVQLCCRSLQQHLPRLHLPLITGCGFLSSPSPAWPGEGASGWAWITRSVDLLPYRRLWLSSRLSYRLGLFALIRRTTSKASGESPRARARPIVAFASSHLSRSQRAAARETRRGK